MNMSLPSQHYSGEGETSILLLRMYVCREYGALRSCHAPNSETLAPQTPGLVTKLLKFPIYSHANSTHTLSFPACI
jgi:hypothetical protein